MSRSSKTACALAHPNIAFIKYWGNRDPLLRIPDNGSISMNLASLHSQTRVTFDPSLHSDRLLLNGNLAGADALQRASIILDQVRLMSGMLLYAQVDSRNNFPTGTGIASSASGFAALAAAASAAAELNLNEKELSRLARRASGSACRSIPSGFTEWKAGTNDEDSYAFSIAPENHWDLQDCIAITSRQHKLVTSLEGHHIAQSSPLQPIRVSSSAQRMKICRDAIMDRDFASFAEIGELDTLMMHAVMMTSKPPLFYWLPATIRVVQAVRQWRIEGLPVCFSIDAGPNVHVICQQQYAPMVIEKLGRLDGVEAVLSSEPGGPARVI